MFFEKDDKFMIHAIRHATGIALDTEHASTRHMLRNFSEHLNTIFDLCPNRIDEVSIGQIADEYLAWRQADLRKLRYIKTDAAA